MTIVESWINIEIPTPACMCVWMHVCACTCINACMCVVWCSVVWRVCVCVCVCVCACVRMCVRACSHATSPDQTTPFLWFFLMSHMRKFVDINIHITQTPGFHMLTPLFIICMILSHLDFSHQLKNRSKIKLQYLGHWDIRNMREWMFVDSVCGELSILLVIRYFLWSVHCAIFETKQVMLPTSKRQWHKNKVVNAQWHPSVGSPWQPAAASHSKVHSCSCHTKCFPLSPASTTDSRWPSYNTGNMSNKKHHHF